MAFILCCRSVDSPESNTEKQRKILKWPSIVNDGKLAGMEWCQCRVHTRQTSAHWTQFHHMIVLWSVRINTQMNHSCDCWHCFISWWLPAWIYGGTANAMVDVLNQIKPRMPFRIAFASALDDSFRSVSPWNHETSNITEMWYTVDVRSNWF